MSNQISIVINKKGMIEVQFQFNRFININYSAISICIHDFTIEHWIRFTVMDLCTAYVKFGIYCTYSLKYRLNCILLTSITT